MKRLNAILRLLKKYNSNVLYIEYKENNITMQALKPITELRAELKDIKTYKSDIFLLAFLCGLAGITPEQEPATAQFKYNVDGIETAYKLATYKNYNNDLIMTLRQL